MGRRKGGSRVWGIQIYGIKATAQLATNTQSPGKHHWWLDHQRCTSLTWHQPASNHPNDSTSGQKYKLHQKHPYNVSNTMPLHWTLRIDANIYVFGQESNMDWLTPTDPKLFVLLLDAHADKKLGGTLSLAFLCSLTLSRFIHSKDMWKVEDWPRLREKWPSRPLPANCFYKCKFQCG